MGIDYCAGYADVIEWNAIVELMPQAAAQFLETINRHKADEDPEYVLAGLARCFQFSEEQEDELRSVLLCDTSDEEDEAVTEIKSAYRQLQEAFGTATLQPGKLSKLRLSIGYHDSESQGCRGDEIDGVYWSVDGAYVLSPAGQQFQDKFNRKFFTSWG
jgi:hypothetical protein